MGLLNDYLSSKGTTRYKVTQKSGIAASTLSRADAKARDASQISTKIILAVAATVDRTPGDVLNELVAMSKPS